MRTTLAIDDDVLLAAKHIAEAQRRPVGQVISDLIREALAPANQVGLTYLNGILQLPVKPGAVVTPELIKQWDDELL